ncbi:MAG: hypothetical protein PWQ86_1763 [Bacillota bacterium]|nr:hypothetical protein [Bacillota bacterium]
MSRSDIKAPITFGAGFAGAYCYGPQVTVKEEQSLIHKYRPLVIRSSLLLLIFLLLGTVLWRIDLVIKRTADLPLLGPLLGPTLIQLAVLIVAGFIFAMPEGILRSRICWSKFLILCLPPICVTAAPFIYFQVSSWLGWNLSPFFYLSGGGRFIFVGPGAFWLGAALALSFRET